MQVVVRGRVPRWWSVIVLGYRVARAAWRDPRVRAYLGAAAQVVLRRASKI